MRAGEDRASVVRFRRVPRATADAVAAADVGAVVSTFETRYGGPVGRDKNIARAASLLDGLVLMPNDAVSYNDAVGPRSTDNGFFPAAEIYKGEMREGIGGGACQVASTLHAAAFFGGLEVLERRNHSRPSGYIRVGLDATVSYPVLDLRIKNPFDFPVVLRARADGGRMRFDLLGKERRVDVTLATETAGILDFNRKLEKAGLPSGEFKLKQKGKRGLKLRKTRTLAPLAGGAERVETSVDTYPAAQEIWLIGPGVDDAALPPLGGAEGV
jgi:vancomycin resistance protein YoaR